MKHTNEEMIGEIFKRMDDWRNLPGYQLERRADLLFSLYLTEVLAYKLNTTVKQGLIPELPIRIGTIDETAPKNNQSKKIDYFALSEDEKTAFLIELKTDHTSIIAEQTETLLLACGKSFEELLNGVLEIFKSDNINSIRRRKYLHLLKKLDNMGQIYMPPALKSFIYSDSLIGIKNAAIGLKAITKVEKIIPVYITPSRISMPDQVEVITFADFRDVLDTMNYNDLVSTHFNKSLLKWEKDVAGKPNKM